MMAGSVALTMIANREAVERYLGRGRMDDIVRAYQAIYRVAYYRTDVWLTVTLCFLVPYVTIGCLVFPSTLGYIRALSAAMSINETAVTGFVYAFVMGMCIPAVGIYGIMRFLRWCSFDRKMLTEKLTLCLMAEDPHTRDVIEAIAKKDRTIHGKIAEEVL